MLTDQQIGELRDELVPDGVPVRFQIDGQTVNIFTGERQPKGINVIHQLHYWHFTRPTAEKIAQWLGAKAIFSE